MKHFLLLFFSSLFILSMGQTDSLTQNVKSSNVIQLSGVLVTGDSLLAVPYANVAVKNRKEGTITDYSGFFSIVARPADTLVFTSIGFKTSVFVLPDTLSANQYSLVHIMQVDTIRLQEVTVIPWPTYEQFKNVFMEIEVPTNDMDRAKENLARIKEVDLADIEISDASLAYKNQMNTYNGKLYYIGQIPPNNLLNPLAWAEFVKAWKNGDLKND